MTRFLALFLTLSAALLIQSCAQTSAPGTYEWDRDDRSAGEKQAPQELATPGGQTAAKPGQGPYADGAQVDQDGTYPAVKVGLLLPLSGQAQDIGEAMLQSAQLALFDLGADNFELMPRDTGGTEAGARQAAREVLDQGAELIIGPLFSSSVEAVKPVAARQNVNVIAFSTDWNVAGGNAYVMGFMPFTQVDRIARFARERDMNRVALVTTEDKYGQAVEQSFRRATQKYGLNYVQSIAVPSNATSFANPDLMGQMKQKRPQAVLIAAGGQQAAALSQELTQYGMGPDQVQRLGTGLWDEQSLAGIDGLQGGMFAAPSIQGRQSFERSYAELYGSQPPRLATLAYDATALAAVLGKMNQERGRPASAAYDRSSLTNSSGFSGVDGIFRFDNNGRVARGLSVLQFRNGQIVEIAPPARSF